VGQATETPLTELAQPSFLKVKPMASFRLARKALTSAPGASPNGKAAC